MKDIILFETRVVTMDITFPTLTEEQLHDYWDFIKKERHILDVTPNGNENNEVRINIDTRFISEDEAINKIKNFYENCK